MLLWLSLSHFTFYHVNFLKNVRVSTWRYCFSVKRESWLVRGAVYDWFCKPTCAPESQFLIGWFSVTDWHAQFGGIWEWSQRGQVRQPGWSPAAPPLSPSGSLQGLSQLEKRIPPESILWIPETSNWQTTLWRLTKKNHQNAPYNIPNAS